MTTPPLDTGPRTMPAIHAADERTTLTGMLQWYREGVMAKVEGMDQVAATASALASGTTAAGLVKHLALVEDSWFTDRLAGRGDPEPWASAPFEHDPDWEFHSANHEPLASSVDLYRVACERSRAVTAGLDLDDTAVDERGRTISLRFVLVHLVEETARHLGHLDVLRELADGRTGEWHHNLQPPTRHVRLGYTPDAHPAEAPTRVRIGPRSVLMPRSAQGSRGGGAGLGPRSDGWHRGVPPGVAPRLVESRPQADRQFSAWSIPRCVLV